MNNRDLIFFLLFGGSVDSGEPNEPITLGAFYGLELAMGARYTPFAHHSAAYAPSLPLSASTGSIILGASYDASIEEGGEG